MKFSQIKSALSRIPAYLFSGLTLLAILWLTLAPKPLGEEPPPLFEGADKIAHAVMFGGLAAMILFDRQRKHEWKYESKSFCFTVAFWVSIFGVSIEFLQAIMGLGRGFEYSDMIADALGSFLFAFLWLTLQKIWVTP